MRGGAAGGGVVEKRLDNLVTDALGVGLEQTKRFLFERAPSFAEFEQWIVATAGAPAPETVARINAAVTGGAPPPATARWLAEIDAQPPVLSAADLAHWEAHGYVVVADAVSPATCRAAAEAIWQHLAADPARPETWYAPLAQGIMTSLFQHDAFTTARRSPRIHKAFAQLWGTADLWVTCDRAGFNPPLRPGAEFGASDLHWDVSLARPIPFGTQGILYFTDTPPEQGAFRCVPGFNRRLEAWLDSLPTGADPRAENLHALGVKSIGGRAGDLIIWHHKLPHGAGPNRGRLPRIVQYLNMYPARADEREEWL